MSLQNYQERLRVEIEPLKPLLSSWNSRDLFNTDIQIQISVIAFLLRKILYQIPDLKGIHFDVKEMNDPYTRLADCTHRCTRSLSFITDRIIHYDSLVPVFTEKIPDEKVRRTKYFDILSDKDKTMSMRWVDIMKFIETAYKIATDDHFVLKPAVRHALVCIKRIAEKKEKALTGGKALANVFDLCRRINVSHDETRFALYNNGASNLLCCRDLISTLFFKWHFWVPFDGKTAHFKDSENDVLHCIPWDCLIGFLEHVEAEH